MIKTMASQTPILANWFTVEPSTDPTIIRMRTFGEFTVAVIRRYMRIYFPELRGTLGIRPLLHGLSISFS